MKKIRIHPDCTRRAHDVAGKTYLSPKHGGPAWYPVSDEVAAELELVTDSPHNQNSQKIFQVEDPLRADAISLAEARQKQSPAQMAVDGVRDAEVAELRARTARQDVLIEALAKKAGINLDDLVPPADAKAETKPAEPKRPGHVKKGEPKAEKPAEA